MKNILIKSVLICSGIVITFIILMDFMIMPSYVRHKKEQYLVNVKNKNLKYALIVLESEGFKGVVSDTLYTNRYDAGIVIDQYPRENTKVKKGRTVRLKISQNEKLVRVPYLVGQSLRSAVLALSQSGLSIDTVYQEYNSDYPSGNITWQQPKGGDRLKKGLGVHIMVSQGVPPNFFQVPNLYGLSLKKAKKELVTAGLGSGSIKYRQNEDLIPYTVLDQSISAGTVLEKRAIINITVSILDLNDIYNKVIDK